MTRVAAIRAVTWLVVLLLVFSLVACGGGSTNEQGPTAEAPTTPAPEPEEKDDSRLIIGFSSDFYTMDPYAHSQRLDLIRDFNVCDGLVLRDEKTGEIKPHLAESYRAIDDLTWEFKLRKGVMFHSGREMTAKDVVFSVQYILENKGPLWGRFSLLDHAEAVDDYTVRLYTTQPWPLARDTLYRLFVVDSEYFQEVGAEGFAKAPVCTGPYKFVSWDKDRSTVFERFDDYFVGAATKPTFKYVEFRVIPEVSTQIAELKTGGIHLMRDVPPDLIPDLKNDPNTYVVANPILRTEVFSLDTRVAPTDNKLVRQAINYAVDWDTIVEGVMQGYAVRQPTIINNLAFGFNKNLKPYPYDPEKAKALLTEAGYPDGISIVFNNTMGGAYRQMDEAVAQMLNDNGITTELKIWTSSPAISEALSNGTAEPHMWHNSWGYGSIFDAEAIALQWIYSGDDGGLYGRYYWVNERADDLIAQARGTLDFDLRQELYNEVQDIMYEEAPFLFATSRYDIVGANAYVDYPGRSDELMSFWDAKPRSN